MFLYGINDDVNPHAYYMEMCTRVSHKYFQPLTCQRSFFLKNVSELAGEQTLPEGD